MPLEAICVQCGATFSPKTIARFWSRVDQHGSPPAHRPELGACWLYRHSPDRAGYGRVSVGRVRWRASRLAWTLTRGAVPPGLCVLHRCDTTACVRPDHLFLGTVADNVADMVAKGRHARGARLRETHRRPGLANGRAVLRPADVEAIRRRYAGGGMTHKALAKEYHVARSTISFVLRGETWVTP